MHSIFRIKDMGELRFFLGIEFARSKRGITMNQRKYALDLIKGLGLNGAKPKGFPQEVKGCKTLVKMMSCQKIHRFQRLIGRLIYLTVTRPDICYVVQALSQFMSAPKMFHFEAAIRVVRYLKLDLGLGLLMKAKNQLVLECYCDSDWVFGEGG